MTAIDTPIDVVTEATLLVDGIVAALVNARIYAATHPRVLDSIAKVQGSIAGIAEASRQDAVRIACTDGLIVFQQQPLLGASIGAARLLSLVGQWGAGGIEFASDVARNELEEMFVAIAARPAPGENYSHLNQRLETRHCRRVRLLPPYVEGSCRPDGAAPTALPAKAPKIEVGLHSYQTVVDLLQNVTVSVCRGGRIDFAPVQAQAEALLNHLETKDEPLLSLARQDQYDAFTFGHSLRVAILAMNFARALTTERELLIRIGTAALLHDVGKSLIPFEILHSTKVLTPEERQQMNRHAELGAECLLDHDDSDPLAIASAFGHHRSPDGSGYPRTTHCHDVAMVTSIVKICDVFEALTAARPYKQPMSPIRAYRVMLAMGDRLDRKLLRKFIEVNGIYPVGQLVELDTGEVAVVRGASRDRLRPIVEIIESDVSPDLVDEGQQLIDLSDLVCSEARSILRELTPDEARTASARDKKPGPDRA
ncbi:MAG: HD domain-containing protein [Planctomycetes bacterium]|nr:HD domain-containing protein [Planctomycetota bacterium]